MVANPSAQSGPMAEALALYDAAPRSLAFTARTAAEALSWRAQLRERLAEILSVPVDAQPLHPETLERARMDGYTRELVLLRAPIGGVPLYVLRPDGPGPFTPALALHGHGPGARMLVGLARGPAEQAHITEFNMGYALALVRRGCIVFVPEQLGFGGRREAEDMARGSEVWSCRQASLALLLLGHTMLGLRVRDIRRTLDYVATRRDVRPGPIGAAGLSGGGSALLYAAALDERLSAVVLSGCVAQYRDSIMIISHCEDNYLPGILRHAEVADILALLAPRQVLVETGSEDGIFPASSARSAVEQARAAYAALGAPDRLEHEVFAGGHRFCGDRSLDWLVRQLS